jgi:purine nucleoside phosphorylase
MDVLAVSLVTNRAAGLGGRLDHADVLATAAASAERMRALLETLLPRL